MIFSASTLPTARPTSSFVKQLPETICPSVNSFVSQFAATFRHMRGKMIDKAIIKLMSTPQASSTTIQPITKTEIQRAELDAFIKQAKAALAQKKTVTLAMVKH